MRRIKATKTAKNMQINNYDKESIARIIMFATFLYSKSSAKEVMNTLDIASTWKTQIARKINSTSTFWRLKSKGWAEKQDISDYISIAVDLLSSSGFFDIQDKLSLTMQEYSEDLMEIRPDATVEEIETLRYSSRDFSSQYYGKNFDGSQRNVSECEKYANLMYLANQLAHIFENKYNDKDLELDRTKIKHLVYEFRKLKNWCIHKVIEEKSHGAQVLLSLSKDPNLKSNNDIINITLPNYLEPFSVHLNADFLLDEEKALCSDEDRYAGTGFRFTFPLYINDAKLKLLREVYQGKFENMEGATYVRGTRLKSFFETEEIFHKQFSKGKLKNNPNRDSKKLKGTPKNEKAIKIAEENKETLAYLEAVTGTKFPDYFKDGFLKRTSYSIKKFMDGVREPVIEELRKKKVPEEDLDKEFAKLIIHMKVVEPLSIIAIKSSETKANKAIECIPVYQTSYEYIVKNLGNETEYKELKSKTKKHLDFAMEQNVPIEEPSQNSYIKVPADTVDGLVAEVESLNSKLSTLTLKYLELTAELEQTTAQVASLKQTIKSLKQQNGQTKETEDRGDNVNDR